MGVVPSNADGQPVEHLEEAVECRGTWMTSVRATLPVYDPVLKETSDWSIMLHRPSPIYTETHTQLPWNLPHESLSLFSEVCVQKYPPRADREHQKACGNAEMLSPGER